MSPNNDNDFCLINTTSDSVFNLNLVHDCFASSLLDENDIDLTSYLKAYKELRK